MIDISATDNNSIQVSIAVYVFSEQLLSTVAETPNIGEACTQSAGVVRVQTQFTSREDCWFVARTHHIKERQNKYRQMNTYHHRCWPGNSTQHTNRHAYIDIEHALTQDWMFTHIYTYTINMCRCMYVYVVERSDLLVWFGRLIHPSLPWSGLDHLHYSANQNHNTDTQKTHTRSAQNKQTTLHHWHTRTARKVQTRSQKQHTTGDTQTQPWTHKLIAAQTQWNRTLTKWKNKHRTQQNRTGQIRTGQDKTENERTTNTKYQERYAPMASMVSSPFTSNTARSIGLFFVGVITAELLPKASPTHSTYTHMQTQS